MSNSTTETKRSTGKIVFWTVVLVAGFIAAFFAFRMVKGMVTSWDITDLPGLAINPQEATATLASGETPAPAESGTENMVGDSQAPPQAAGPTPEPWDGASRVNVLVMGLDYNDWRAGEGPPRTDSMILFTIDPVAKTAGVLSIPRDLWVNIPGYGYYNINQAYQLGEANKLPGGGP